MIRDEILAAMHEAGAGQADEIPRNYEGVIDVFTRFAAITYAAGAKDAYEISAKVIENDCHDDMTRAEEAAAIRARGEK